LTAQHYIVFLGAGAALSEELLSLGDRVVGAIVVAPGVKKKKTGINSFSIEKSGDALFDKLRNEATPPEKTRLSIWAYGPPRESELKLVWDAFGRSAWIEFIPNDLKNKLGPTKQYIEKRIKDVVPAIHSISTAVYGRRKSSPLSLPLRNFRADLSADLSKYWYRELVQEDLDKEIKRFIERFRQQKSREFGGFVDDRNHCFAPAEDGVCHGQPHPTGVNPLSFIGGRFRFGAAIFKGFHYEVASTKKGSLRSVFVDSENVERDMNSENRQYINIFPNDFMLPTN